MVEYYDIPLNRNRRNLRERSRRIYRKSLEEGFYIEQCVECKQKDVNLQKNLVSPDRQRKKWKHYCKNCKKYCDKNCLICKLEKDKYMRNLL